MTDADVVAIVRQRSVWRAEKRGGDFFDYLQLSELLPLYLFARYRLVSFSATFPIPLLGQFDPTTEHSLGACFFLGWNNSRY